MLATRLGVKLDRLGELAGRSRKPAIISSMCVVFAETEIIGLLASGVAPEDIVAGVQASIATRVAAMAGRNLSAPIVLHRRRGPGARHGDGAGSGLGPAGRRRPATRRLTCALGAAILAWQSMDGLRAPRV